MWLLLDAGNTRIKWALLPAEMAQPSWHAQHGVEAGWLGSGAMTHSELAQIAPDWAAQGVTDIAIVNVAGAALRDAIVGIAQQILRLAPSRLHWFASSAATAGVRNGYRTPRQLGCDRFAALIGARALFPERALIVANCGTATTIDALDANGQFIGGMILPGLTLMTMALARHTAQLPQVAPTTLVPSLFAQDTDAAIASGCLYAQVGAIEAAVAAHAGALCLLSGGAAAQVAPALSMLHHRLDNLVLLGLQVVYTAPPSC